MKKFIRSFFAIDISDPLLSLLESIQRTLHQKLKSPVKWVDISKIHLTIKFISDLDAAHLGSIEKQIRAEISPIHSFQLRPTRIGVFPNQRNPRVIWVGVNHPPELIKIAEITERVCCSFGYPAEDRKFSPHLTLARIRNSLPEDDASRLRQFINDLTWEDNYGISVSSIRMYESQLSPSGPRYNKLFIIGLRIE